MEIKDRVFMREGDTFPRLLFVQLDLVIAPLSPFLRYVPREELSTRWHSQRRLPNSTLWTEQQHSRRCRQ
jgi:hypothetical protein